MYRWYSQWLDREHMIWYLVNLNLRNVILSEAKNLVW